MIEIIERTEFVDIGNDGIATFVNSDVVIPYDGSPDGGRTIHQAATIRDRGNTYRFVYREKYYEGLTVWVYGSGDELIGEGTPPDPDEELGEDDLWPSWAVESPEGAQ